MAGHSPSSLQCFALQVHLGEAIKKPQITRIILWIVFFGGESKGEAFQGEAGLGIFGWSVKIRHSVDDGGKLCLPWFRGSNMHSSILQETARIMKGRLLLPSVTAI